MSNISEMVYDAVMGAGHPDLTKAQALCANSTGFCKEFLEKTSNIVYIAYIFLRLFFYSFILFLSTRIPKDFLKNFTLLLFIPFFFDELATIGLEFIYYLKHFDVGVEGVSRMMNVEIAFETMHRVLFGFADYAFLIQSLVVYYGLFRAFLDPDGYEKCRIGRLFYTGIIPPIIIVILMNIPWKRGHNDAEVYIKHTCRIVLGILMALCYLFTVCRLTCRAQIRDTKIDDRSIIRRAKSRLIWFTIYMTVQNILNVPGFIESIFYLLLYSFPQMLGDMILKSFFNDVAFLATISDEIRGVGLTFCTLFFIPVYREAIFFCRRQPLYLKSPVLDLSNDKH